jgi:hypothetical protein
MREERWGKDHKCQGTIQLHVVQEMVYLLHCSSSQDSVSWEDASELMCLSVAIQGSSATSPAMQVEIYIQGRPYSMLIDSGSSHYFLNAKF